MPNYTGYKDTARRTQLVLNRHLEAPIKPNTSLKNLQNLEKNYLIRPNMDSYTEMLVLISNQLIKGSTRAPRDAEAPHFAS